MATPHDLHARSRPHTRSDGTIEASMKLSDYILKFVADLRIKDFFLVTGGGAIHLNQSLAT